MRSIAQSLTILFALGISVGASADTFATYNFNGTFQNYINGTPHGTGTVSGIVAVDTTSGKFVSADFTALVNGNDYLFNTAPSPQGVIGTPPTAAYVAQFFSAAGDDFQLALPVTSLVGYAGSGICTSIAHCQLTHGQVSSVLVYGYNTGDIANDFAEVTSGSLTPATAVSPEPTSLVLLGTGFLGMFGAARRKFFKN